MTYDQEIADASRPSAEPPTDRDRPGVPGQDCPDGLTAGDDDERRRMLRDLVMRALV